MFLQAYRKLDTLRDPQRFKGWLVRLAINRAHCWGRRRQVEAAALSRASRSEAHLDRENIYWHFPHYHAGGDSPYGAVRARQWKLVEFYEDNRVELYNLANDLGETNDLAKKNPEKAEELRKQLHQWRLDVDAQMPTPNPDHDPAKSRTAPARKKGKGRKSP